MSLRIATLDVETFPTHDRPDYPPTVVGVAVSLPQLPPMYCAFGHPSENNGTKAQAARLIRAAYDCDRVDFHNASFDLEAIEKSFGIRPPPWNKVGDTMFMLALHDPHTEHLGLKDAAEKLLGEPPTERDEVVDWLLAHQPVEGVRLTNTYRTATSAKGFVAYAPGKLVARYAIGDVRRTRQLERFLRADLKARRMLPAYERECELRPILNTCERRGVRVDVERLERDIETGAAVQERLDTWLRKYLRTPSLNLNSGQQLAQALLKGKFARNLPVTSKGSHKTDRETLEAYVTDKRLTAVFRYRSQLKTCIGTFMRPWLAKAKESGDRIFTDWHQLRDIDGGARTGRISSTPNLQNPPEVAAPLFAEHEGRGSKLPPVPWRGLPRIPNTRLYILAEKGHVLIDRDFSQQEARVLAHYDGGSLRDRYLANPWIDFHDFALEELKKVGRTYPRRIVKNTNFGLMYGMGVGKLAQNNGITVEEAKTLKAAVLSLYPGLRDMYQTMRQRAQNNIPIRTWGGREYYCQPPELVDGEMRTYDYKLVNVLIQGSAADATKQAILNWHHAARPEWHLLINVHDELLCSVPKGDAREAMAVLREAMESVKFSVPMLTEGSIGENWGRCDPLTRKAYLVLKRIKTKFDSWSISRLNDYTSCPRKAQFKHLLKIPEPQHEAMERGIRIHKDIEDTLRTGTPVADIHESSKARLAEIRAATLAAPEPRPLLIEGDWVLTRGWAATHGKDWTGAWLRAKVDCAYWLKGGILRVVDWKTGKYKEQQSAEYMQQLELYALLALVLMPLLRAKGDKFASLPKDFVGVRPSIHYVDHGMEYHGEGEPVTYTPADVPRLKKKWLARVKPMLTDDTFAPRPSGLCQWCHYGQKGIRRCEF